MKKKQKQFNTPILFVIFNRPDTTRNVFETIRKIKPTKLFVAADGPRMNNIKDGELCNAARMITEKIDWKCDIRRLYRKSNLGCGRAVSGAVTWFFKNVESGIILEDDCLPNLDFYHFANKMLAKFKLNNNILHVSGNNFLPIKKQDNNNYFMTKYAHVWGWASWKRAWKKYDFNMTEWLKKNLLEKIRSVNGDIWDKLYWTSKFDSVAYKITDTWDYQWLSAIMQSNSYAIGPGSNLVSNIGFGINSTHTASDKFNQSDLKTFRLNKNIVFSNKGKYIDKYEKKYHFRINSIMTIINFAYFSIICMIYNKIKQNITK